MCRPSDHRRETGSKSKRGEAEESRVVRLIHPDGEPVPVSIDGALAEVLRHRIGGGDLRVLDAAPTGFSDARFVVQPAYRSDHRPC